MALAGSLEEFGSGTLVSVVLMLLVTANKLCLNNIVFAPTLCRVVFIARTNGLNLMHSQPTVQIPQYISATHGNKYSMHHLCSYLTTQLATSNDSIVMFVSSMVTQNYCKRNS